LLTKKYNQVICFSAEQIQSVIFFVAFSNCMTLIQMCLHKLNVMFFCTASQSQLTEYEQKLFAPNAGTLAQTAVLTESFPSLGFGFPKPSGDIQVPAFNQTAVPSIFERAGPNNVPSNFTFGAEGSMGVNPAGNNNGAVAPT
jgi:dual specificity MAP kinase phosphatase